MTSKKWQAFKEAAEHMAQVQGYSRTLEASNLVAWVMDTISDHRDVWDLIWRAARKAERDKWQDATIQARQTAEEIAATLERADVNVAAMAETSKKRLERIRELEHQLEQRTRTSEMRAKERDEAKHQAQVNANTAVMRLKLLDADTARIAELTRERDDFKRRLEQSVQAHVSLQATNSSLRAELDQLKQDFVTAGTRFTMKALDEAQARIRELETELQNRSKRHLAILAQEKTLTSDLRKENVILRERVTELTYPKRLCGATDTPHRHTCARQPGAHRTHACDCGHEWQNSIQ